MGRVYGRCRPLGERLGFRVSLWEQHCWFGGGSCAFGRCRAEYGQGSGGGFGSTEGSCCLSLEVQLASHCLSLAATKVYPDPPGFCLYSVPSALSYNP